MRMRSDPPLLDGIVGDEGPLKRGSAERVRIRGERGKNNARE